MVTTDPETATSALAASAIVDTIREAELVQLVAYADGDCLAATGLLAAACAAADRPYHVGAVRTADGLARRLDGADASATSVVVGARSDDVASLDPDGPASLLAAEVATALGGDPAPVTALAGVVAAGAVPSRSAADLLAAAGLDRVPGVGIPTTDLADGLAHSGLVHAPWSGDLGATNEALDEAGLAGADPLTGDDARRVASLVALAAATAPEATERAATAVERVLRPYPTDGPFATLAGRADVLSALAEAAPGLAVALSMADRGHDTALDVWRDHAQEVHEAVRAAQTARYRGVLVARTDGPMAPVARLLRDFRSPEPLVLAVGEGEVAAAGLELPVAEPLQAAAEAAGGSSLARGTCGHATFDADQPERFIEAFREATP